VYAALVTQKASTATAALHARPNYKYYDLVMAAFVTVLLCSNLIGPAKLCTVGGITFGAGNIFFPISYIFGDILTEVYGYSRSRRVIWVGFAALIFASIMSQVVIRMPGLSDPGQVATQAAIEHVFGGTWRIVLASICGFWAGEFANSYTLAKMKVRSEGKHLWIRFICSTIVGQAVDTAVFYPLAFFGIWTSSQLFAVIIANYVFKVLWEILGTPMTYAIVGYLKRTEHEDYYDRDTNFSPFTMKD
jgi:uncharacterized integral membrane protein (TIGR00697 family)